MTHGIFQVFGTMNNAPIQSTSYSTSRNRTKENNGITFLTLFPILKEIHSIKYDVNGRFFTDALY